MKLELRYLDHDMNYTIHRVNNHYIFGTYVVGCYIWYYSGNFGGNERVLSYKSTSVCRYDLVQ